LQSYVRNETDFRWPDDKMYAVYSFILFYIYFTVTRQGSTGFLTAGRRSPPSAVAGRKICWSRRSGWTGQWKMSLSDYHNLILGIKIPNGRICRRVKSSRLFGPFDNAIDADNHTLCIFVQRNYNVCSTWKFHYH